MDIFQRLEEYSVSQGDRIAYNSRSGVITYKDLWQRSGRLASAIEVIMGDNRDPILVFGHKDPMMIVSFLACVRSGRAYCPMDLSMPEERITQVAEKIGKPLVLLADPEADGGFGEGCRIVRYDVLESISKGGEMTDIRPCEDEDVFYIIFTSGTTGRPKGVQITTNNLNNYLGWAVSMAGGIEPQSIFLNQAPYSFDLSVMDLYVGLATGGTIVAIDSKLQKDHESLREYVSLQGINYWVSTPSFASLCLSDDKFDSAVLPEIKAFLFCGETLTNETALELIRRFPAGKVINSYGPTESTVCVTAIQITEEMARKQEALPVGKVKKGSEIQLDPETSEIIIIGDTVSPGYYKSPGLTKNAFFVHHYSVHSTDVRSTTRWEGVRAYRTGDKGHFDDVGLLFCDGRLDNQLKLHGYRIEIEDIEENLRAIDGVKRAAVSPRISGGRVESLTAFIVRDKTLLDDDYSGRRTVRMELKARIPAYMVPKRIQFIEELPITNNGKIDRNKLKEMA